MKRKWLLLLALVLSLLLTACGKGDVSQTAYSEGISENYTRKEIGKAMDVVTEDFRKNFKDCSLLELSYDQSWDARAEKYAHKNQVGKTIILTGTFHVSADIGPGVWVPDATYSRYQWTLVKTWLGGWKVVERGYA